MIADWWAQVGPRLADTMHAMLLGLGMAAGLILVARWLFRAGGPFNK